MAESTATSGFALEVSLPDGRDFTLTVPKRMWDTPLVSYMLALGVLIEACPNNWQAGRNVDEFRGDDGCRAIILLPERSA